MRGGDGLGGKAELVGTSASEEVEGVEDSDRDDEDGHWSGLY